MARVLAIDIGTSSIRAGVHGATLQRARTATQVRYRWRVGTDGGVEAPASHLEHAVGAAIDGALDGVKGDIDAVAVAAFWHSLVGVDAHDRPLTGVMPWTDTRSGAQAIALREALDEHAVHARTGCRIHPTYWPARLRWFAEHDAKTFRRVRRWMTFPGYLEAKWLGRVAESRSQASATGFFLHDESAWDDQLCDACGISPDRLAAVVDLDDRSGTPSAAIARRWPQLARARWIPAAGDGALNNLGANCTTRGHAALMIGTSGALREMWTTSTTPAVPFGLWRYWLDRRRVVIGGALSNGGNFVAWMRHTLGLDGSSSNAARVDARVARIAPDSHGLTVLPFLAGERSPDYPPDAFATIAGLRLATTPHQIFRAGLEGIAFRFLEVMEELVTIAPVSRIIATGTALTASRVWPQIVADALGCPVEVAREAELTSRGAAILAFEQLGITIPKRRLPVARVYHPDRRAHESYRAAAQRQHRLLRALC